ncbi:hypothetical protein Ppa06_53480 [Planomonospora parontospora subsp. parontospora]|uniref:Uncharacterized protein n=2 Tax=Planomonospora parontospora TaxID=58119 RepID=A0AA37BLE9_9ACTN|nr:hypothetical protein [Planomonospora parontospora]GGK88375.1 hypothetical protein GCM10010126_54730 [Planomonospora parontospora]GII11550.1 hypothetical protein Ppa06_53480 [Planomonospora parontospora subsp. parontospora]
MEEDDRALSPEEMLRLIDRQDSAAVRRFVPDTSLLYLPWGLAWLVGFGALFLHHGLSGRPYAPISIDVALAVLFGAMLLAGAVNAFVLWRTGNQVRGASQQRGMMYGLAWPTGFLTMSMIADRFAAQLPEAERNLLWASMSIMLVSVLYMAGAAVWHDWPMFAVGIWMAVLNAVGTAAGAGWHALLIAVGGGGGFIVAGLVFSRRVRR